MPRRKGGDLSRNIRKKFYKGVVKPGYKMTDSMGLTHHYSQQPQSNTTTYGGRRTRKTRGHKKSKRTGSRMSKRIRYTRKTRRYRKRGGKEPPSTPHPVPNGSSGSNRINPPASELPLPRPPLTRTVAGITTSIDTTTRPNATPR